MFFAIQSAETPLRNLLRLQVGALCFDADLTQIARLTVSPQGVSVRRAGFSGGRNAQICSVRTRSPSEVGTENHGLDRCVDRHRGPSERFRPNSLVSSIRDLRLLSRDRHCSINRLKFHPLQIQPLWNRRHYCLYQPTNLDGLLRRSQLKQSCHLIPENRIKHAAKHRSSHSNAPHIQASPPMLQTATRTSWWSRT